MNILQEFEMHEAGEILRQEDNKERFNDWNIPEMDCQMIMLSVSEDEEIRVVNA